MNKEIKTAEEILSTCPANGEYPVASKEVDHPQHYGGDTLYEAIKVIEAWDLDFCLGNTVKYISRAGKKDSDKYIQDLEKALWYLNRKIEQMKIKSTTS